MSVERTFSCWRQYCRNEPGCEIKYLDCLGDGPSYDSWRNTTQVFVMCDTRNNASGFVFGIFADSWKDQVTSADIVSKYFYCLWFGLRNLRLIMPFPLKLISEHVVLLLT